jgi:hypothetical protein
MCKKTEDYFYHIENWGGDGLVKKPDEFFLKYIPNNLLEKREWLNQSISIEEEEQIQLALKKHFFRFSTTTKDQKAIRSLKRNYGIEQFPE